MRANKTLLQMKYARIIPLFAEKVGINTKQALDFFYHSVEYQMLREGVSDLHCMDEDYIAENLADEWREVYLDEMEEKGVYPFTCQKT